MKNKIKFVCGDQYKFDTVSTYVYLGKSIKLPTNYKQHIWFNGYSNMQPVFGYLSLKKKVKLGKGTDIYHGEFWLDIETVGGKIISSLKDIQLNDIVGKTIVNIEDTSNIDCYAAEMINNGKKDYINESINNFLRSINLDDNMIISEPWWIEYE